MSKYKVTIEAVGAMTVRFNVYQTVFPLHDQSEDIHVWAPGRKNLAGGIQVKDNESVSIAVGAGDILELDKDIPVRDIEIISAAGNFTVTVM